MTQRIYNPAKFNPARGGHAQGHLRDAFLEAVEVDDDNPVVAVGYDEVPMALSQLCGLLWNCTDVLPSHICDTLDLPLGSTYAVAARALRLGAR